MECSRHATQVGGPSLRDWMGPMQTTIKNHDTPMGLREGVRSGILVSLIRDFEMRGARTARLLGAAGVIGVGGALGATLMVSGHPFDHHPPWHVAVFAAIWAGLLVVSLSIALLQVRTPSLPLAHAACVGILGLGLAGICGALCPDQHFLRWWSATEVGGHLAALGGLALSALCFGGVSALLLGVIAAFVSLLGCGWRIVRPLLPAAMMLLLLLPGVALQSVDTSWEVFASWLLGIAGGSYVGVAGGIRLRSFLDAG
jgi:hypothetical protein